MSRRKGFCFFVFLNKDVSIKSIRGQLNKNAMHALSFGVDTKGTCNFKKHMTDEPSL